MDDSLPSIFSSKPFEFVVQGERFFIHSALIAKVSKPLERHANNEMREARDGEVSLEEVEPSTFARFCNWAYAGCYDAQSFSERSSSSLVPSEMDDSESDELPILPPKPTPSTKKMKKSLTDGWPEGLFKKEAVNSDFLKLQYGTPDDERSMWVPRANMKPSEDYTDTFLSHARLYVFAERFDIQPLKRLVLRNLHQTLANFTVWPGCVGDIVALLTFVYDNTLPAHNGEEPLRRLLSQYVGFKMDKMLEATAFRDLLEKNRDILNEFCAQVMKRIEKSGN